MKGEDSKENRTIQMLMGRKPTTTVESVKKRRLKKDPKPIDKDKHRHSMTNINIMDRFLARNKRVENKLNKKSEIQQNKMEFEENSMETETDAKVINNRAQNFIL